MVNKAGEVFVVYDSPFRLSVKGRALSITMRRRLDSRQLLLDDARARRPTVRRSGELRFVEEHVVDLEISPDDIINNDPDW